mgnify:CR=1 FL=1
MDNNYDDFDLQTDIEGNNFDEKMEDFRKIFDSYQTIRNFWKNKNQEDEPIIDTWASQRKNQ